MEALKCRASYFWKSLQFLKLEFSEFGSLSDAYYDMHRICYIESAQLVHPEHLKSEVPNAGVF